jgi:alpha/beta superfamily hydrolase
VRIPEWLKPALYGALAGAAALAIAGFSWGGWVTGGKAEQIASDRARLEVVAALVPVCLEQSNQDPVSATTLVSLTEARPHKRDRMLMDSGWATMPGATDPNSAVARACMQELAARF